MSKDYLKEFDGGVEITLAKPVTIDGAERKSLRMREPTVRDMEDAQKAAGDNAAANEIQLFANLMEVSADDVRALTMRNYKRVQGAYEAFTD